MFVDIDKKFVLRTYGLWPNIGLIEDNQVESPLGQSVATESERLRIEEIAVNTFNPTGLAADVPRRTNVTRAIFEFYCDGLLL
jgi:hypothetical protein